MRADRDTKPSRKWRLAALLAVAALAAPLAACGDDEEAPTLPPPSLEQWQARVNGYCSDGIQEAVALPLPTTTRDVPADARARAEILVTVYNAVIPLPPPEGKSDFIDVWLEELSSDTDLLNEIARTAAADGDYLTQLGELDESAGEAALTLGLDQCAALANAIARTP